MASKIAHASHLLVFLLYPRGRDINPTNDQLEEAISFSESLSKFSGVVVVFGLVIEAMLALRFPERDPFIQKWGTVLADTLVVLGVAGEIFFGSISGRLEKKLRENIRRESEEKIAVANERAAEAKSDAARVSEYAEQLRADNIALQAGIRPRRFSFMGWTTNPTRVEKIYDSLKPYAGTVALIQSIPDFESQMFARDIASVLEKYGWLPKFVSEQESHMSNLSFADGLFIFTLSNGKTQTEAGSALWIAMKEAFHEMGSRSFDGEPIHEILTESKPGYPSFDPSITGVFIRVGLRQLSGHFLEIQRREMLRQNEDWDNQQIDFVKRGGKLSVPSTDGSFVETKIGQDGKLVSADPSKQIAVPDRSLTLVMPGIKIRSTPPREGID